MEILAYYLLFCAVTSLTICATTLTQVLNEIDQENLMVLNRVLTYGIMLVLVAACAPLVLPLIVTKEGELKFKVGLYRAFTE